MFYLTEERRSQGILPDMSVRENATINALGQVTGKGGISRAKETALAREIVDTYDVKTPDLKKEIKFLSGGNQQKVIIGRCMCCNPKVLIFDEPTKGIDVGTKTDIYRLMKELAEERGMGIILISSEMEEVRKCANRILCMYDGRISGEYGGAADKETVLSAMLGLDRENKEEE